MLKEFDGRIREAFMAGWSRKMTWDEYSEGHTDWVITRYAFMQGYTRMVTWENFSWGRL